MSTSKLLPSTIEYFTKIAAWTACPLGGRKEPPTSSFASAFSLSSCLGL
ncbi:hypothetical protein LEMLEM_LOCUS21543 [Lemmus lemmus]